MRAVLPAWESFFCSIWGTFWGLTPHMGRIFKRVIFQITATSTTFRYWYWLWQSDVRSSREGDWKKKNKKTPPSKNIIGASPMAYKNDEHKKITWIKNDRMTDRQSAVEIVITRRTRPSSLSSRLSKLEFSVTSFTFIIGNGMLVVKSPWVSQLINHHTVQPVNECRRRRRTTSSSSSHDVVVVVVVVARRRRRRRRRRTTSSSSHDVVVVVVVARRRRCRRTTSSSSSSSHDVVAQRRRRRTASSSSHNVVVVAWRRRRRR